jgi:DNA-binding transcriptional ArsR family regulator
MTLDDNTPPKPASGSAPKPASSSWQQDVRTITDARTMRALSHPVRIAIVEALQIGGPMTATEVGERIGETPTTCSFHLRQLAKYGWVEEAGGGKGRARPWRMSSIGFQIESVHEDPETDIAASSLASLFRERQLRRYQNWLETRATYPPQWRTAANESDFVFYLTLDEFNELNQQLYDLLMPRFTDGRITDPSLRPAGAVPVELLTLAYPMELPKADGSAGPGPAEPRAGGPGAGETGDTKEGGS